MSVHGRRLPSGAKSYEVRWRERNRNRSRSFSREKDANDFDRQMRLLRQQGELAVELNRRRVTVNDLYADWLERLQPGLAAKTAETYGVQLDLRVLPAFGGRRVAQITVGDIERWIGEMRTAGTGDPTIIKACTVLQSLLSMAVRDGVVSANVAQQARKPPQGRTRIPYIIKPLSVEMMRLQLQAQGRERDIVLLELLAYAGLRPESEAIKLPWRYVRDRTLIIRDTKRHRERTVPIIDPLLETLNRWRLRQGRPGMDMLVAPNNGGTVWSDNDWRIWHRRVFKPVARGAGLPDDVRSRDLRGSFVSLLVHEGRNIVEVARQVGHSPVICLRDYAQVFDDQDPDSRVAAAAAVEHARAQAPAALQALREDTAEQASA
jgi:site-specific recombinase XerD